MSHPDPNGPPDLRPIEIGEVWENPVTRERATILELPTQNADHRSVAELTVTREREISLLREGESATIEANVWHDWWNTSGPILTFALLLGRHFCERDARVRVEVTPGERFGHMVETLFGLARLGHTDAKGMPDALQLALFAREFSDVVMFRSPPLLVQRLLFGALAPIARWRGYRATYPQLSRSVLATET